MGSGAAGNGGAESRRGCWQKPNVEACTEAPQAEALTSAGLQPTFSVRCELIQAGTVYASGAIDPHPSARALVARTVP